MRRGADGSDYQELAYERHNQFDQRGRHWRRCEQRRKARGHSGTVTCVDKSNVFTAMAFFRQIFDEVAQQHSDITKRHNYVDAMALDLIRKPWAADVLVMENHGVLAVGPDLETAYLRLELVEHLATIQFKATQLGGVRTIPSEDISILLEARNKAGLGFPRKALDFGRGQRRLRSI